MKTLSPLGRLRTDDTLYHYLIISFMVVSSDLVNEDAKGQLQVYYVSNIFSKLEINYLEI